LRALGYGCVTFGKSPGGTRAALSRFQQFIEPAFAAVELFQREELRAIEPKQRKLLRRLPEILPQPTVVFDELRIVENKILADQAFERRRLLVELPARASCLCRLEHRLLTLRSQAIQADNEFDQCIQQGRTDQKEPEQDELDE